MKFFWQSGSADKLFSDDVVRAAVEAHGKWKIPASVSIAQYGIESGWGKHTPGNNPFGMKPRQGRNDPSQLLSTTEFIKGEYVTVQQPFRKFNSIAEAFDAHAELLATAPVYHAAVLALPDINRFIDLMSVHYATDPLYASKIKATIAAHSLANYDTH